MSGIEKGRVKGMFVVDLDGTLLNQQRKISEKDLASLHHLQKRGYLVVAATGRSNYSFEQLIKRGGYEHLQGGLVLPFNYVIISTGAGIMEFPSGKLLNSVSLKLEQIHHIVQYLDTLGIDYMIHREVPDTRYFSFNDNGGRNSDFRTRIEMYRDFASPLTRESLESFHKATEVLCIVPEGKGHNLARELVEALPDFSVIKATSPLDGKSVWIEIFAISVSKSLAVEWLADSLGIQHSSIGAVGNDYNDEDLLYWVEQGFVMANSPASLKKRFPVVASNNQDGVSEAIELWLQNGQ